MSNESFKPDLICLACEDKIGGLAVKEELVALAAFTGNCSLCKKHTLLIRVWDLTRRCPICKKWVPLDEWSFSPARKKIRLKCDRCAKKAKTPTKRDGLHVKTKAK